MRVLRLSFCVHFLLFFIGVISYYSYYFVYVHFLLFLLFLIHLCIERNPGGGVFIENLKNDVLKNVNPDLLM